MPWVWPWRSSLRTGGPVVYLGTHGCNHSIRAAATGKLGDSNPEICRSVERRERPLIRCQEPAASGGGRRCSLSTVRPSSGWLKPGDLGSITSTRAEYVRSNEEVRQVYHESVSCHGGACINGSEPFPAHGGRAGGCGGLTTWQTEIALPVAHGPVCFRRNVARVPPLAIPQSSSRYRPGIG